MGPFREPRRPQEGHQAAPLGIMRNLIPSAPEADFQARWNWDARYDSLAEVEQAQQRYTRLRRFALQAAAVAALPGEKRLRGCLRVHHADQVDVKHSPTRNSAWYCGLVTCGSVWMCPVCAAKVSERRRAELGLGLANWKKVGGSAWLTTLTFSHQQHESLPELRRKLQKALKLFQGGRAAEQDREDFAIVGQVRALEVTHGKNGWHPHIHQLVFTGCVDTKAKRDELQKRLYERWYRACDLAGLGLPNEKHGVRVDGGARAGEYITKWGLESELTKHVVKDGRGASRTPMGILADFLEGGDLEDAELFGHYARAMKGAKQLTWSRGLRELLGLGLEQTDEELAEADEAQAGDHLLATIPIPVWKLVLKYDVRGQLLVLASRGDGELVAEFLERLVQLETA